MKTKSLTLPIFLEFVELKTKVASVFPMIIGFAWSQWQYHQINVTNSLLFALAVIAFDMCTTAINNTMDYHKAYDTAYQRNENVIGKHQLNVKHMTLIIYGLLASSCLISIILVIKTDLLLLPMGALCFLIGIFYTFGPFPLSRLPLGELFSGVTMGFGIFFLAIYVQDPHQLFYSQWTSESISLTLKWMQVLKIALMSLPLVVLISNIMLANNICDYQQDLNNRRYTLIHYLGEKNSRHLYVGLHSLAWLMFAFFIIWQWLPFFALLIFLAYPLSLKTLLIFLKKQIKQETFIEAIKNFVLVSSIYVILLLILCLI
ncbi:UNVERIFIED_CONTAM: 1,4-dihydroxy-2-naphthoate polyprenyltransferase [Streptococcus canis]|uniref:1,4-dihydroxy-2-naphthoate octaprenyltransferase n=1 Tax=Streptococcus canis FSL Z3-227 TaxID=482234 RepID=A0AAV3FUB5_STRCB|nr:1,4-dihydroxy-2-naphthoate polyprenyltransferase [Streptococcus canis]EIQ81977.1 1,4-dihydroxy-2-naphthoate octaprenyltransferase [Streptococcus canis FSL Z3-227]MDV5988042.1 1,4-dihydroxy-2-naphthoate polyprenyltransferase [Streptococcus canis]MDV5993063.1 1,4-dihydroxy-2-naphthoate polyprenyltransferase [Streptococcus canis]MDV6001209.1 1,4-dihydroxy-2-naphthoate polyprenyltransferase [Streptococcus canis]MDV6022375.1 1,4-dihydroxy-2-naphthoate polyprenyltransferase [Streptococcus canis]